MPLVLFPIFWNDSASHCLSDHMLFRCYHLWISVIPKYTEKITFRNTIGRTQCCRLPALRGVWGRVVLSAKPFPHKCAEAGAWTRHIGFIIARHVLPKIFHMRNCTSNIWQKHMRMASYLLSRKKSYPLIFGIRWLDFDGCHLCSFSSVCWFLVARCE